MDDHLESARAELDAAAESADDDEAREQFRSIINGIEAMIGEGGPRNDRLEELRQKIAAYEEESGGETRARLEAARGHLDSYRVERDD